MTSNLQEKKTEIPFGITFKPTPTGVNIKVVFNDQYTAALAALPTQRRAFYLDKLRKRLESVWAGEIEKITRRKKEQSTTEKEIAISEKNNLKTSQTQ